MTDADFHRAIRYVRRVHWLHYPVQGLLMAGAVLVAGAHAAAGPSTEPQLATWPALLSLVALVPVLAVVLVALYRRLRPSLRRPAEENLRIYLGRIFLRNSLAALVALPMLGSYAFTHSWFDLGAGAAMLLALCWRLAPSAHTYQRWLLS
ncbi:hypothetical protein JAO73_20145 [Hymenobacter sp. BT523]|uniref:hypothetical protein n=1 Tax=Hymenobacter sp. BT523 TaxID=2795725 RepID=UPI0018EAA935|nr:hypothetical protein [Hymenobacter sp. BT523]MBJ6111343.1 hypothetical protein [Hymenobacter sp. BT523]